LRAWRPPDGAVRLAHPSVPRASGGTVGP